MTITERGNIITIACPTAEAEQAWDYINYHFGRE